MYGVWILIVPKIPNEVPKCDKLMDAILVIACMLLPSAALHCLRRVCSSP